MPSEMSRSSVIGFRRVLWPSEVSRDDVDGFLTLGVPVQTIEESVPKRYRAYLMRRTDEIPPLYGDKTLIKNINKHLSNND